MYLTEQRCQLELAQAFRVLPLTLCNSTQAGFPRPRLGRYNAHNPEISGPLYFEKCKSFVKSVNGANYGTDQ